MEPRKPVGYDPEANPPGRDQMSRIHFSQLLPASPDSMFAQEWETYCREVGRLIAVGQEGRHVVIQGTTILGSWPTHQEARDAGIHRGMTEPFFIHQIQKEETLLRIGYSKLCRS
jgi:hypothetical protein